MPDFGTAIVEDLIRGTQLLRTGRCEEALATFRAVYANAQLAGNTELMAVTLCEMAWCCYRVGQAEQGLECAMGAKWLWGRLSNRLEMARAMAVEAILFLDLGCSDEAFELSSEALAIAEVSNEPSMHAFTLNAKGIVLTVCREAEMGAGLVEHALSLAIHQNNEAAAAYYLLNLGFCHSKLAEEADALGEPDRAMGERETAIEFTTQAINKAQRTGDLWTQRAAIVNNAELLSLQGRHDLALDLLDQCADLPECCGIGLRIHFLYTQGEVLLRAGRLDEARAAASQAVELGQSSSLIDHHVNAAHKLAQILEAQGDTAGALNAFKLYHSLYVRQSGETAQRRARVEATRAQTDLWRSRAAILADQALSDPLTGIANRRSFDQILGRLSDTPHCAAIIDLDHFKLVNDRFSHLVGDAVLQRVARTLVLQLGAHGHAARLGGEEFALALPNVPETSATAFCEGIRLAIANIDWSDLAEGLSVTVSIGLASSNGDQTSGELMQMADDRLYAAKANGRNCVVSSARLSSRQEQPRMLA